MKVIECPHEAEVLEAVASNAWEACGEELESHARECAVCADVLEVAVALRQDYRRAVEEAQIPSPSLLWWRAELRLRQEAVRTVTRPITLVHAIAAASCIGMVAALAGFLLPSLRGLLSRVAVAGLGLVPEVSFDTGRLLMERIPIGMPYIIAVGCCLMLASVAAYWILSEE